MSKSVFSTNAQSRFASVVVDGVLGPPRLTRHTWQCPCISVVPEATHEASRGPEKGAVSAQKALRGSETEMRELLGGTEENIVSPMGGHWFTLQANQWFFTKRRQKKLLMSRPAPHQSSNGGPRSAWAPSRYRSRFCVKKEMSRHHQMFQWLLV